MDGQTSSRRLSEEIESGAFSAPSASFDPAAPIAETISRNSKASSSCSDCSQNVHNVVTASDLELNPFLGDVINADAAALGPDLESFGDLNVSHGLAPPEDELQLRGRERSRDRRSHAERRSNSRGRRARSRSAEPERSRERKRDGGGSSREESLPLAPAFGSDPWSDPLWASMEIAPPLSAYEPHVTAALDEITATSTLVSNDHHHHHHHMHKKSSGPLKRNVTFDEKDHQHHNHHQHHHHEIYRDGEDGATHKGGEGHEHFSKEEFGEAKIRLYDRMVEDNHDHIFCSVRPLQYFVGDVLHRERTPRKVTWDELFLDLIFISTISRSESYIKVSSLTFSDVNKFALVFTPVWMHWILIHHHSNRFATYDMYFKVYTWIQMILTAGMGLNIENVFTEGESNTANIFLITVLIARALYIISHCRIYWTAPEFSFSVSIFISVTLLGSLFYLISLFLPQSYIPALWWTAFAAEHLLQNLLVLVIRRVTPIEWSRYRVAFNIEHYIERFGFFTIIMLGEVIVNILWDSYTSTFSWSYVTTAAGLLVSISLQWLYYNVDGSRQYTHALRRSVPAAVMWTTLHYPFHLSIVLGGAAMSKVISLTLTKDLNGIKTVGKPFSTVDAGLRWALMGGLSASLFFLALLGVTHKSYEPKARPKLAKRGRMLVRLLVAVVFAPVVALWGEGLKATGMLVLAAGLCVGLTVVEEWGRLVSGKPGKKEKRKRKRRQAKEGESGKAESVVVEDVKDDGKEVVEDLYKKEVQPITIVD